MIQMAHATRGLSGKRMDGIKAPYFDGTQPCRSVDPDLFFPEDMGNILEIRAAKEICYQCNFKQECLEYVLDNPQEGIWGGTTDKERRLIRRKR